MSGTRLSTSACALAVLVAGCGGNGSAMHDDAGSVRGNDAGSGVDGGSAHVDGGGALVDGGGTDASTPPPVDGGGGGMTLSAAHPGDVGMGDDPSVVWFEDFEEGSLSAIAARYDQVNDNGRWSLVSDTPNGSGSALALRAGMGQNAVDFYKQLPDSDEWYVRWYAHYEAGVPWHHSGVWFGGYNPSMRWPSPMAGLKPNGDDRFSIAVEPVFDRSQPNQRFDFYNYWMAMHSWMAPPIQDTGTAYYGNSLVHQTGFTVDNGTWVCLEVHVRLNPDPSSGAGAVLEVWKNDALVQRFDDTAPLGYWIRDKFCTASADGPECTNYPAPATDTLDLQFRNSANLHLNAFWPQNYITDPAMGTLIFDQMVVATRRIGCMR